MGKTLSDLVSQQGGIPFYNTPSGPPAGFLNSPKKPWVAACHPSLPRALTPVESQIARSLYNIVNVPGCTQLHGATYHAQRRTGEFDCKELAKVTWYNDGSGITIYPGGKEAPLEHRDPNLRIIRGSHSPWGDYKKDCLRVLASYKAKEFGDVLDQMIVNMEGSYIEEIIADAWTARMLSDTWASALKTSGVFKCCYNISEGTTDDLTALLALPIHVEPNMDDPRPGPNPFHGLCPLVVDASSIVSRQYYDDVQKERDQAARKNQFQRLAQKFEEMKKTVNANKTPPPSTGTTGRHPQNVIMDDVDSPPPRIPSAMEATKGEILRLLSMGVDPQDLSDQQKILADKHFRKAFKLLDKKRGPK